MSMSTHIPGIVAKHKIVTPGCQRMHGITDAAMIALDELKREYEACNTRDNRDAGAEFHFVLTVDRPNG